MIAHIGEKAYIIHINGQPRNVFLNTESATVARSLMDSDSNYLTDINGLYLILKEENK